MHSADGALSTFVKFLPIWSVCLALGKEALLSEFLKSFKSAVSWFLTFYTVVDIE
jgi:hypothetical protein